MKVNGPGWVGKVNPYQKTQKVASIDKTEQKRDKLQISDEAKAMLDQLKGSQDVERKQKIERLKEEVQSGKYKVDEEKVAEKLMEWWGIRKP